MCPYSAGRESGPVGTAPYLPTLYPGILSEIIPLISPPYFSTILAGITASPGESIAGTTSPAPFGPGTLTIPFAYFLALKPGCIIPGNLAAAVSCATIIL